MLISVIICTLNRSRDLNRGLKALGAVRGPSGIPTELIVVDNGSSDDTRQVVESSRLKGVEVRYVWEPRPALGMARNTGLRTALGEIIVFTDDDVRPEPDWLELLTVPLIQGDCDAAVGRIRLAPELCRPWMDVRHLARLAVLPLPDDGKVELVGANMGFHRRVLERVPAFDPELGPGVLGCCEETLFSLQLRQAGFRMNSVPLATVVHYPDPLRLLRSAWLASARSQARSEAYILHHWRHEELKRPLLRMIYMAVKLQVRRKMQAPPPLDAEGIPLWEMSYVKELERCRHFLKERRRPRNYTKHGLIKLGSPVDPDHAPGA